MKHILVVLVENKPGVLTRVAGLFSRRGFNIDSIAVGQTLDPNISRMTITVEAGAAMVEQIIKQLNKLINVLKISNITEEPVVTRELMLIKVKTEAATRGEIQQIVETFRGKIVDVGIDSMVVEVTGDEEKLAAMEAILHHYGIREIARTGKIALLRGSRTTRDELSLSRKNGEHVFNKYNE